MKNLLSIIDSLLFAVKPGMPISEGLVDSTLYKIVTQQQSYCGNIIFQDDMIIKFRTEALKPVKILKANIRQIDIVKQTYQG